MNEELKKKRGRPFKPKVEHADKITLTIPKDVKEKIKLIKQLKKFNASKFFAKKIKEEAKRQS